MDINNKVSDGMKDGYTYIKDDVFVKIKHDFERLSDKDNAEKMSKYMRYKFKFYGIKSPERKSIYKGCWKV